MAKVIGPLHSAEARGRVSGLIYNTWRGISTVKAFCAPAQPRTKLALQIRAWTTMLVRYWQTLDSVEREGWNTYAVNHPDIDWTGNPKRISGLNWFVRCNLRMLQMVLAIVDTAPIEAAPNSPETFGATGGVHLITVTWLAYPGTDTKVDIWLFGPHSAGILPKITRAKHYFFKNGEDVGPHSFEAPLAGTYTVFARAVLETNGLASTWVKDTVIVT